jgi:hypothetical protein
MSVLRGWKMSLHRPIFLIVVIAQFFVGFGVRAQLGNAVYPETYGATGNGSSNDGPAVADACSAAFAAGIPLVFRQKYRAASSANLTCNTIFSTGAVLLPDNNVTITVVGSISAPQELQIFGGGGSVSASTAPSVSVAWWGASPTALDSAPAFQAAGGSSRVIFVPPASSCYVFNSTPYQPYSTLNATSVWWKGFSNFKLDGYGACIKAGPNVTALYNMILFDQDSNFVTQGLQFFGTQNAPWVTPTTENSAISIMSVVYATFRDLNFPGNWGGLGAPFVGDYIVNSLFGNMNMPTVGLCFDVAFLLNVTMEKITAVGSDGSTGRGAKCLSIIYDTRNPPQVNKTGYTIADTNGFRFVNSDISNFQNPAIISSGVNYYFSGNRWHDNPTTTEGSASILFYYFNGDTYSSVGHPIQSVIVNGDNFLNNGTARDVMALGIGASQIKNSDIMRGFTITNSIFSNNNDTAIGADTVSHIENIDIRSSNQFFGNSQKIALNENLIKLGARVGVPQILVGNVNLAGSNFGIQGSNIASNQEQSVMPIAGTLRNLYVTSTNPPGDAQKYIITLRYQREPTSLSCTISGPMDTACHDATDSTHVENQGIWDLQVVSSSGAASSAFAWALEFDAN